MSKPFIFYFKINVFTVNKQNIMKKSKYQKYFAF